MKTNKIVVTRHKGLVQYLINKGLITKDVPVISHATVDDVRGKHVIGVLPLWLAVYTDKMTIVKLRIPTNMRGKELTEEEVATLAPQPRTYKIHKTSFN